jgi:hypothetical protein
VIRAHPIRVAGESGGLPNEITWEIVATDAGLPKGFQELSTVSRQVRRVGRFDPDIVRRAIEVNRPDRIVLNHLDLAETLIGPGEPSPNRQEAVVKGAGAAPSRSAGGASEGAGGDRLGPASTFNATCCRSRRVETDADRLCPRFTAKRLTSVERLKPTQILSAAARQFERLVN